MKKVYARRSFPIGMRAQLIVLLVLMELLFLAVAVEGAVTLTVVTENNTPIEGVSVFVNLDGEKAESWKPQKTDPNGLVKWNALPASGTFIFTIYSPGYYPTTINVKDGAAQSVTLRKVLRNVLVKITDQKGRPLPGKDVLIGKRVEKTNDAGDVTIKIPLTEKSVQISINNCGASKVTRKTFIFTEGELGKKAAFRCELYEDKVAAEEVPKEVTIRQPVVEAQEFYDACFDHFKKGTYDEAMTECKKVPKERDTIKIYENALLLQGVIYLRQRQREGAVNAFQEITKINDNNANANLELGIIAITGLDYERALRYLTKAHARKQELSSQNVCRLFFYSTVVYQKLGRLKDAREYLEGYYDQDGCSATERKTAEVLFKDLNRN